MKAYLGTYTKKESQGVYVVTIRDQQLTQPERFASLDNPTYVTHRKDELFSVVKDQDQGGIAYVKSGNVVNACNEPGSPPCYVSLDAKHDLVYSANYHGGRVNSYRVVSGLLQDVQRIQFGEGSKAHYIRYHEQLDRVVVCDLGLDQVVFFEVDALGQLQERVTFLAPKGSGPRHAVNHPTRNLVYVFSELSSQIFVLKLEHDRIDVRQQLSTLPEGEDEKKWGAAIRISQDGRFVYVSNRGHDSISVFAVDEAGELSMIQNISTYGVQPRDFNLSMDGSLCLVANHDTNNLTLFKRDAQSGRLSLLQNDVWAPEVVCVDFME